MSNFLYPNACGEISRTNQSQVRSPAIQQLDSYVLSLPVANIDQARIFLEGIGGSSIGAGRAMSQVGINAPLLRATYKREIETMVAEIERRLKAGESKESIARWASTERNRIIDRVRSLSGTVTRGIYEIRDWRKYGAGGRTWSNIEKHYAAPGRRTDEIHEKIIKGAQQSNPTVTNAAMNGASFLKHGGRVVLVVGVAISAARIWNASEQELPSVIGQELGGLVGGSIGAGASLGVCIIYGIATSGWGLLACGVVGGIGGGVAGSYAGGRVADGVYYSDAAKRLTGEVTIEIPTNQLYSMPPLAMCLPNRQ